MASSAATIAHIIDTLSDLPLTSRKMFGEYALYLDGRVVALICDDTLFLKDLPEARALLPDAETGAPYPGAKPHLIADRWLDEPDVLAAARALAAVLPPPKPKRKPR